MLIHWTKTFSYDFRTSSLMNQLECVTNQIVKLDPMFGPNVKLLLSDIMSKVYERTKKSLKLIEFFFRYVQLNILDRYEQYLQLIDNEISNRVTTSALTVSFILEFDFLLIIQTDIYEQCPCPKEFAHQLTHIELVRLNFSN